LIKLRDSVGLFDLDTWRRAVTFKRKTEGLNNLDLKCPICGAQMARYKNEGLNFEEKLFSVIPYYCEKCKRLRDDYPIYNVGWRSEEARGPVYYIIIGSIMFILMLTVKLILRLFL